MKKVVAIVKIYAQSLFVCFTIASCSLIRLGLFDYRQGREALERNDDILCASRQPVYFVGRSRFVLHHLAICHHSFRLPVSCLCTAFNFRTLMFALLNLLALHSLNCPRICYV